MIALIYNAAKSSAADSGGDFITVDLSFMG